MEHESHRHRRWDVETGRGQVARPSGTTAGGPRKYAAPGIPTTPVQHIWYRIHNFWAAMLGVVESCRAGWSKLRDRKVKFGETTFCDLASQCHTQRYIFVKSGNMSCQDELLLTLI